MSGITYGAEWSPDLADWTPVADTGSGDLHDFSVSGSNEMIFVRLTVTGP